MPTVPEELHTPGDPDVVTPESATKKVLHCSSASRSGMIEGRLKPHNQDSYLVCEMDVKGESAFLLVVSDGHGESGHAVSSYVTTYLPCFFLEALEKQATLDIGQALKNAYQHTNESMKQCDFEAVCSGATCVTVLLTSQALYCANVGDSRAILAQRQSDDTVTSDALTQDHKPFVEAEQARIIAAGGRVQPQYSSNGQAVGPLRVWFQRENTPGLAMTRAMGDFLASSIGVIATPGEGYVDVVKVDLADVDAFVVLASDGVWEFMSTQEVVEMVQDSIRVGRLEESAQVLINEAARRWSRVLTTVDDITAIVAFLG